MKPFLPLIFFLFSSYLYAEKIDTEHIKVIDNTSQRQHQLMESQFASSLSRSGVWRDITFAFGAYYLNTNTNKANTSILKIRDQLTSVNSKNTHWQIYLLARLYWLFSSESDLPRIGEDAEKALVETLFYFLKRSEFVEPNMADSGNVWAYQSSENHHLQAYISAWSAAHILKTITEYKSKKVKGYGMAELAYKLDNYFKQFFREKATKGLLTEVASPTYAKYSLSALYNIYDFAEDRDLRAITDMFLNVYFSDWGIEQLQGLRGGSKHRAYPGRPSHRLNEALGWIPFAAGKPDFHPSFLSAITTSWRPHELVAELILKMKSLGSYEIISRRPGIGLQGGNGRAAAALGGKLLRYTFVTPNFIAGMSVVAPLEASEWTNISIQNRRNIILFNGDTPAKIFTQRPNPPNNKSVYNAEWGVQDKGVMILQLMPEPFSKSAKGQLVYFSNSLVINEESEWIFVEAPEAFAAIKVIKGKYHFRNAKKTDFRQGRGKLDAGVYLELAEKYSPVIFEVHNKSHYQDMKAFREEIKSNPLVVGPLKLHYESKGYDNSLTLYTVFSALPKVNGKTINLSPNFAIKSPFLNADFGGSLVEINSGDRRLELDFVDINMTLRNANN